MRRTFETAAFVALATAFLFCTGADGQAAAPAAMPTLDVWAGVREVGFPATAFYLLWRMMQNQLRDNTRAIDKLNATTQELRGYLARMSGNGTQKD